MKKIAIIIFDNFTDIDLFLMWDLLAKNKNQWDVKILGTSEFHVSSNGLNIKTHGNISEACNADILLFSSGSGTRNVINDKKFLESIHPNPNNQIIGSICSGSLILGALGLLRNLSATTHPRAKEDLKSMGVNVLDMPFVCHGNIATAGGCLSAIYLVGWVTEKILGPDKKDEVLKRILPVGQAKIYQDLISTSINQGKF